MADLDILGILSLLLAAGGAAYLVRARILGRSDPPPMIVPSEPVTGPAVVRKELDGGPEPAQEHEAADPPQAMAISSGSRRAAEPSAADDPERDRHEDGATDAEETPEEPSAVEVVGESPPADAAPAPAIEPSAPALTSLASDPKDGSAKVAAKDTLLSAGTPPKKAETSTSKSKPPPKKAEVSTSERRQTSETGPPPSRSNKPLARTIVGGLGLSRPAPLPPKEGAAPSASAAEGAPARRTTEPPKSSTAQPDTKKTADLADEVPRLEYEEDEELEPTRFGGKREIQPAVEKIVFDEDADADASEADETSRLVLHAIGTTDPGKRRKHNEDALLVLEEQGLFVVADGMGGHRGGQLASKLAVKTVADAFEANRFAAAAHPDIPGLASELARAIQMSNTAILEHAAKHAELKGMGTTICAMRFSEDRRRLYIGHVGDSRCYRLRDGVMKQLTTDHTMSDYGIAGPEGAHLSRALGVWPTVPIDVVMAAPRLGDLYLLCSDGLTKMLPNETIATQLLHEEDPKTAINRLVFFANAHGGKDNITIVLIRVVEAARSSS